MKNLTHKTLFEGAIEYAKSKKLSTKRAKILADFCMWIMRG